MKTNTTTTTKNNHVNQVIIGKTTSFKSIKLFFFGRFFKAFVFFFLFLEETFFFLSISFLLSFVSTERMSFNATKYHHTDDDEFGSDESTLRYGSTLNCNNSVYSDKTIKFKDNIKYANSATYIEHEIYKSNEFESDSDEMITDVEGFNENVKPAVPTLFKVGKMEVEADSKRRESYKRWLNAVTYDLFNTFIFSFTIIKDDSFVVQKRKKSENFSYNKECKKKMPKSWLKMNVETNLKK